MGDRLRMGIPPRCNQLPVPRPTQPPALNETGNEYQPKCGDGLRLGSKGRMARELVYSSKMTERLKTTKKVKKN